MGYLDLNSGIIQEYNVEEIVEAPNSRVLHLTIFTEFGLAKYRICEDSNEGPLEVIRDDLSKALSQAIKSRSAHFGINEFKERYYLFMKFPDGSLKQYTGGKMI
jgi:hypothetical protein